MQKKHDKRLIAADMLEEAINKFKTAKDDLDYIQSILLAGKSIDITNPLLSENQKQTAHEKSAENVIRIREHILGRELNKQEREDVFSGVMRFQKQAYNALKHASKGEQLAVLDDLEIEINFAGEAKELLWAAIEDFKALPISPEYLINNGKNNLILLIGQSDPLGGIPKINCKTTS